MIEILTRDDLSLYPAEFIEEVRNAISIRSLIRRQGEIDGQQVGVTLEEYRDFMEERVPEPCPRCHGKGEVLPSLRGVGTIHPSGASRCTLRLFKDVMGADRPREEISLSLMITFEIGHAVHALLQRTLHNAANWDLKEEIEKRRGTANKLRLKTHTQWMDSLSLEFQDEVRVQIIEAMVDGGRTDGVIEVTLWVGSQEVRVRIVLEIKTMSEKQFIKLTKPKDAHRIQAHGLYATACDAPFVCYLYVVKSYPHDIEEFVETYDFDVYNTWYRNKLEPIEEAIETGTEPVATAGKYECDDCSYKHGCAQRAGRTTKSRLTR